MPNDEALKARLVLLEERLRITMAQRDETRQQLGQLDVSVYQLQGAVGVLHDLLNPDPPAVPLIPPSANGEPPPVVAQEEVPCAS